MKIVDHCVVCGNASLTYTPAAFHPFVMHRIFQWIPVRIRINDEQNVLTFSVCKTITCANCDFEFVDIRFDDEEMRKLYSGYREEEYTALREYYEPGYRQLNDELDNQTVNYYADIEAFILNTTPMRPRKVLDWGGNNGINTPFRDAEIHIFDIAAKAPKYGKAVIEPEPPYDLIVCSNVLEHVPYPRVLLRQITPYLNPESLLYLEVPRETHGQTFWHEHINRFNEQSLAKLIEICGLRLMDMTLFPPPKHGYEALIAATCKLKETA